MARRSGDSYAYALVGIVVLVALVGVVLMIKMGGASFGMNSENLFGQAGQTVNRIPGGSDTVITANVGERFLDEPVILSLISTAPRQAVISIGTDERSGTRHTLLLGDTLPYDTITITLVRSGKETAGFIIDTRENACTFPRDGQSQSCLGASACCGGTCQQLPDCGKRGNGPVNKCGERQLYCCDGKLGFVACGNNEPVCGNGICEESEANNCPVCQPGQPCPDIACVPGTCPTDCTQGIECSTSIECPIITCVVAPCPPLVCLNGRCVQQPLGGTK